MVLLSSDADNADSFNDYVAVLDEIHQAKNDEMYGKLRTGARSMGRAANNDNYNGFQRRRPGKPGNAALHYGEENRSRGSERPGAFTTGIYEADKDCNVEDETQWYKSNPALGVFRKLEDLANFAKRIRLMPLQENMFRRMFLNQHVALDHEKERY